ncbi:amino acid transporter protein [Methylobacterium sp. J-076]|uniref:amino acid transporter protein n=1 Tax=Methylobacterium sp. J-076 TaxID=2836655 RepID=UPI001FBA1801|nr:amino acid transporter protein [Methylobacterium sp. J-076]MCJ2012320.1 amino acid transporter protein [Methylobacterium sp. J-076]
MSAEDDEARRKLSATHLNGLAVAVFAVGGFAAFISTVLASGSGPQNPCLVFGLMAICWMVSGAIHSTARTSL